jgi:hypothetical protein
LLDQQHELAKKVNEIRFLTLAGQNIPNTKTPLPVLSHFIHFAIAWFLLIAILMEVHNNCSSSNLCASYARKNGAVAAASSAQKHTTIKWPQNINKQLTRLSRRRDGNQLKFKTFLYME